MRIVQVTCDYLLVSVPIPVRETRTDYGVLLVTLETDTGLRGYGFAREHELHALAVRQLVLNDIAIFLKRLPDVTPQYVWHEANWGLQRSDYKAASGITARAASAVDQALWDLRGKQLNQPIWRLLGGVQPEIEIYATFGLNIYTQEEETEAARRAKQAGFTAFKLQGVGADRGRNIHADANRLKHLREMVGDDARIILDARNAYTLHQAIELAKSITPYNPTFLDEPVNVHDPQAMLHLRKACPGMPLAARGRTGALWENRDLILSGAVDVMGTSVMDQCGFTQSIKVAHAAEMAQLQIVTGGGWHTQNAHLIAAVGNGWMTEHHALAAGVTDYLFVDEIKPVGGRLRLTEQAGLGITLQEDAVKEARERARAAEKR